MVKPRTLTLEIHVVELSAEASVAVTSLGGMTIRGERSETYWLAVRSLFAGLAGRPEVASHQDAAIALDLALAETTLAQISAGRPARSESRRRRPT